MIYCIPDMTIEKVAVFSEELNKFIPTGSFTFDFSNISNFEPLSMLVAGNIIKNYIKKYPDVTFSVDGLNDSNKKYLEDMGFFKFVFESPNEENLSCESSCIPITPIFFDDLQKKEIDSGIYLEMGNVVEKESARLAEILVKENAETKKLLTFLIREMLRNTPEHAKTREAWICGRNIEGTDIVEITAADEGIGIFNSITSNRSHREYINDNAAALQWVLKAGISKAFSPSQKQRSDNEWANSGFGLYMISRICLSLGGSFSIISNGNYIELQDNQVKQGETLFCGTAVKIRLCLKELNDAQSIISTTAKNGEAEAKTIRNAFKKSSKPSNGLMDDFYIK